MQTRERTFARVKHNAQYFRFVCAFESNTKSTESASTFFVLSCKRYLVMILFFFFHSPRFASFNSEFQNDSTTYR